MQAGGDGGGGVCVCVGGGGKAERMSSGSPLVQRHKTRWARKGRRGAAGHGAAARGGSLEAVACRLPGPGRHRAHLHVAVQASHLGQQVPLACCQLRKPRLSQHPFQVGVRIKVSGVERGRVGAAARGWQGIWLTCGGGRRRRPATDARSKPELVADGRMGARSHAVGS